VILHGKQAFAEGFGDIRLRKAGSVLCIGTIWLIAFQNHSFIDKGPRSRTVAPRFHAGDMLYEKFFQQ